MALWPLKFPLMKNRLPSGLIVMRAPRGGGERPPEVPGRVVGVERPDGRSTAGYVRLAEPIVEALAPDDAIVIPAEGVFEPPSIETCHRSFPAASRPPA